MKLQAAVRLGILAALAVAAAGCTRPSCTEPVPPANINASTATEAQMKQMRGRIVEYQGHADDYQECLVRAEKEHKAHPPFLSQFYNDGFAQYVVDAIDKNQKQKVAVVGAFNDSVRAYNKLHP